MRRRERAGEGVRRREKAGEGGRRRETAGDRTSENMAMSRLTMGMATKKRYT